MAVTNTLAYGTEVFITDEYTCNLLPWENKMYHLSNTYFYAVFSKGAR